MSKQKDRQYLLNNIPADIDEETWKVIVRLSTRDDKKTTVKFVLDKYGLLTKRRVERNEKKYEKLGKDLSIFNKDLLDRHLKYVRGIFDYEKKRQENIEKKALQLISQSSIIISIITLAIGTLSSKFVFLNDFWFYILVILFSSILLFLFLTLYYSISSLKIKLFNRPDHILIVAPEARDEKKFIYCETSLLYNAIEDNEVIDNKKALQMNKGYKFFKFSIVVIIVFSALSFYAIFKLEKEKKNNIQKIEIVNSVDIKSEITNLNENIQKLTDKFIIKTDTTNTQTIIPH